MRKEICIGELRELPLYYRRDEEKWNCSLCGIQQSIMNKDFIHEHLQDKHYFGNAIRLSKGRHDCQWTHLEYKQRVLR